jgi:hypothetical protein
MPECTICGEYTKFEGGLCLSCYKGGNNNPSGKKNLPPEKQNAGLNSNGISEKEWNYRYNMIKGRIAETLVQELFLTLKYNVFRYGMENTIPGIMELLKGIKSEVAEEIKRMPDFVVQNPRTGEVFFIEVKFRANVNIYNKRLTKRFCLGKCFFYPGFQKTY